MVFFVFGSGIYFEQMEVVIRQECLYYLEYSLEFMITIVFPLSA